MITDKQKNQIIAEYILQVIEATTKSKENSWDRCFELQKLPIDSLQYKKHFFHHGAAVGIGEVQAFMIHEFIKKRMFTPPSLEVLKILSLK